MTSVISAQAATVFSDSFGEWSSYTTAAGWTEAPGSPFETGFYGPGNYDGENPNGGANENANVFMGTTSSGTSGGYTDTLIGAFVANTDYTVSLYLAGVRSGVSTVNGSYTIALLADNVAIETLTVSQSTIAADKLALESFTFNHAETNTGQDIAISITYTGRYGTIDEVTLTAVPEPSSAALLGLGGLALILRRRK